MDGSRPGPITLDIFTILTARQVWEGFQDIQLEAPDEGRKHGTFRSWFNASYLQAQGLAVRRQVDIDRRVVSLGRLLKEIEGSAQVISRQRFLAEHREDDERYGNDDFDRLCGKGATHIPSSIPRDDFVELRDKAEKTTKWVSTAVAHFNKEAGTFEAPTVSYDEVHGAIDLIFNKYRYYCGLLLDTHILGQVMLPPWEADFKQPWLPTSEAFGRVRDKAEERARGRR